MKKQIKVIVEKHIDGYVAYPLGMKGVVVAQGDSYEEALSEIKSAIDFHIETFGKDQCEQSWISQKFPDKNSLRFITPKW